MLYHDADSSSLNAENSYRLSSLKQKYSFFSQVYTGLDVTANMKAFDFRLLGMFHLNL